MRKIGEPDRIGAPRLRRKPEAPDSLKAAVERARQRTSKRDTALPLRLDRDDDGALILDQDGEPVWTWPFEGKSPDDWPDWSFMFVDAFGTRNSAVASTFTDHLLDLCGTQWDDASKKWVPNDGELQLMLAVVRSHKPRDEAQAALAAQVAATYIITMRVGKRLGQSPHDTRMISAYARLLQASAAISDVARPGRKKAARQSIKVVREIHNHHHQHVHLEGDSHEKGNRPHEQSRPDKTKLADRTGERTPLSRDEPGGQVVRMSRHKG
ncbi:hypothetical protein [Rhizorhabdus sp.]|jgi:hypothetical protein|uniref:hypothetical protein n=1 Tax=Rhizorhabdus sp. TaxID=1968843 RepID=UPI0019AFA5E0|nr:hypothetical protein [Rhizorhabdus sp.]MBD3761476.1 hypothetical protein [Rhizorhabdus sp.]